MGKIACSKDTHSLIKKLLGGREAEFWSQFYNQNTVSGKWK
jgi:hypothetical protein